jgi:hypothetical protein
MRAKDLWTSLKAHPFPYLHELAPRDRDGFVLLDTYLRGCLEEWITTDNQLSAHSIVLLDDCVRSITKRFQLLDSEGQYYFGQFRGLAKRILRNLDMNEASLRVEQEMNADSSHM